VTESVLVVINGKRVHKLLASLLVVHELTFGEHSGVQDSVSLLDITVWHSVGETKSANTDTFQDTVTSELMKNEMSNHHTGGLDLVGDNATDEVRRS
jgi:hypothetical protein